ncbi:rCG20252 [Rattus norvegicus]|uniref:RCG20252 n=1 Tax=Rattus norvegicus TaxID=10116 RepID=A6JH37_RAT|nr:rCG20252 [Rattus norvegicus]
MLIGSASQRYMYEHYLRSPFEDFFKDPPVNLFVLVH